MNIMNRTGRGLSRREAIQMTLGACGFAALGPVHRAVEALASPTAPVPSPATQKFLVVVELDGGNDGLNTVVPQGLANYQAQRPSLALGAGQTLAIDTGMHGTTAYRLHAAMPSLAQMYRDGEMAIVQKVGYPQPNGSHDTSKQIWAAGQRQSLLHANGWIARYAGLEATSTLGAVSINRGRHRSMVGGTSNPLMLRSMSSFRFDPDSSFRNNHDHRLELIKAMLEARSNDATRDALLTGHQLADQIGTAFSNYTSTATYGTGRLAGSMQDVARMLQAGFETRVFYTGFGGFDTHAAQGTTTGRHPDLLSDLDEALKGFADDCKAMGIWNNCVVAVISEFGRRCFENGSTGTDHGRGNCVLLCGGAVRGGLHGPMLTNEDVGLANIPYGVDFRAIYKNILGTHLGMANPDQVFPEDLVIPDPVVVV